MSLMQDKSAYISDAQYEYYYNEWWFNLVL